MLKDLEVQYKKILSDYIEDQSERNLYLGQNFVKQLIQKNVTPEEVANIHKLAIVEIFPTLSKDLRDAHDFLIEVMVHYGLAIREHQMLVQQQEEHQIEMNLAARIQSTILQTSIPLIDEVDIGMLSIPVRNINGDYVHFLHDKGNYVSIAVTDVVGKGVPAALCMSMIKYSLETLGYAKNNPSYVLEVINRIVEKSIDDSMFVSMLYGRYDIEGSLFTYGSAGHEPALYFDSQREEFVELEAHGLLLGVLPEVKYPQFTISLQKNDFIVMMTDGVTEFRTKLDLDSREIITSIIFSVRHLSSQEICEHVYKELEKLQDFKISDDFTIVVLKNK